MAEENKAQELDRQFEGKWKLDKKRSDKISPFLKEVGAPWIARKAADSMSVTLVIELEAENTVHVTQKSSLRKQKNTMVLGKENVFIAGDGSEHKMKSYVKDKALYSEGFIAKKDLAMTTSYALKGADELELTLDLKTKDGRNIVIRRLFVRKSN